MSAQPPAAPGPASPGQPRPSGPTLEQAGASDASLQRVHGVLLREKPEPAEGYSPVPITLLFVFSVLVFWAGTYLERYSGGFNPLVYDFRVEKGAGGAAPPPPEDPMKLGARLFTAQCVACHQSTGLGVAGAFPPLAGSEWVVGPGSERVLPKILLHGMQGPIQVKGNAYNGAMPAFGQMWRDNQIAAVLTYIRAQWGNSAPPITPEEVAAVRAEFGTRPPWPGPEIQALLGPSGS